MTNEIKEKLIELARFIKKEAEIRAGNDEHILRQIEKHDKDIQRLWDEIYRRLGA